MYSSISENKRNTILIFSLFVSIISGIGLFLAYRANDFSIFWATLLGSAIYASVEYFLSAKLTLFMAGARSISRSESPEFYAAADWISQSAGLPLPKLYVIYDPAPNAFAAGLNPNNAVICVTTGLLEIMDKPELEGVIAHEMAHIKNYDIRVSMMAIAITAAIGFISDIALRLIFLNEDSEDTNPMIIVFGIILVIIAPVLAMLIRMAISREREYLADATAIMFTRYPDGLISALDKLQYNSRPMQKQSSTVANLFIVNPLRRGIWSRLLSTHPSIEDRIQRLRENSARF